MKVADYIIGFLADKGIDKMFVVYGAANGDLIDAFTRNDKTEYVAVMHEQGGGFAAEGYAKVAGRPGVAIATSGPGGQNMLTSMGNCFYDSIPCIFITGQINSRFLRPDPSIRQVGFQETDIVAMAKPVTKHAVMLTDPETVRYEIEKAWHLATEGRPGPILLDIPLNIQKMDITPEDQHGFEVDAYEREYNLKLVDFKIDQLLKDIVHSERPCMLIGGGVRLAGAVEEFRELGKLLKMPCFPTWNALDVVSSDYEYYGGRVGTYGGAGRNFGIQNSDLLLAIGCRLSGRITGGNVHSFARGAKKYVVDVDKALLQKKLQQVPFDENIYCDAKVFLTRMIARVKELKQPVANSGWLDPAGYSPHKPNGDPFPDFTYWVDKVMGWKTKYDPVQPEMYDQEENVHPYVFFRTLSEEMDRDAILIGDCGGNIVASNHAFQTKDQQRNLTNNGNSPMGFSFAAVMGCYLADPSRQSVCTIGDGGFNMNIQELQTFINYNIKAKTFIVNNHIYGITKAYQETNFNGRAEACGPKGYTPPDFVSIVKAYGIKTVVINNHDELEEKIREVLDYDGPVVCDVNCHEYHTYEPKIIGWETPIEDMYPYIPRDEFIENMTIKPLDSWKTPFQPDIK